MNFLVLGKIIVAGDAAATALGRLAALRIGVKKN
jgi:hypothetical protein